MTNLANNLIDSASRHADRPAVRLDATDMTYTDLLRRAKAVAVWMRSNGLEPGDRVVLMIPTCGIPGPLLQLFDSPPFVDFMHHY